MKQVPDRVAVRPFRETDLSFVMRSWLDNYRYSSQFAREIGSDDDYYPYHRALVAAILARPTTQVHVACEAGDEDHVYGYAVLEQQDRELVLHYAYVKPAYRGFGIGRTLMLTNPTACTHLTATGKKLLHKFSLKYNPYLI